MADPEIDVLWHGEWIIRELMASGCYHIPHARMYDLQLLVAELERIRKMRVARWQARQRAKASKRRAAIDQQARGDRRVRELLRNLSSPELK